MVLRFRSVKSIVIAPANTGRDRSNKIAVIKTDQGNKGIRSRNIPRGRRFKMVTIKLMAPIRDETPAKCKLKIARSTEGPEWYKIVLSGG